MRMIPHDPWPCCSRRVLLNASSRGAGEEADFLLLRGGGRSYRGPAGRVSKFLLILQQKWVEVIPQSSGRRQHVPLLARMMPGGSSLDCGTYYRVLTECMGAISIPSRHDNQSILVQTRQSLYQLTNRDVLLHFQSPIGPHVRSPRNCRLSLALPHAPNGRPVDSRLCGNDTGCSGNPVGLFVKDRLFPYWREPVVRICLDLRWAEALSFRHPSSLCLYDNIYIQLCQAS